MLHLNRGDKWEQRDLVRRLAELQYKRNDLDFHRATYRVRGDVIDVFLAESDEEAVRIEPLYSDITGRNAISIRLICVLLMLKQLYDLSD